MRRLVITLATAGTALVALASPAFAHVTIQPSQVPRNSFVTVAVKVPNETEDAATTKVEVQFPTDHPLSEASVQPVPGWTADVTKKKLTTPLTTDEGDTVEEAVDTITWTATGDGIEPNQFQMFPISIATPDADSLTFKAVQTYDNGDVVRWIEEPVEGEEADKPAPVLTLAAGEEDGGHGGSSTDTTMAPTDDNAPGTKVVASTNLATKSDVDDATSMATIGIVIGALGLIVAIVAIVLSRKKPAAS